MCRLNHFIQVGVMFIVAFHTAPCLICSSATFPLEEGSDSGSGNYLQFFAIDTLTELDNGHFCLTPIDIS